MATSNDMYQRANDVAIWLEENVGVYEKAIAGCDLGGLRLCDAIALNPNLYVALVDNVSKQAKVINAPRQITKTIQEQLTHVRAGQKRLPHLAYSWMAITQLRGIESKAKARSILKRAILNSPDKKNTNALTMVLESVTRSDNRKAGTPNSKSGSAKALKSRFNPPRCGFCCILGCVECVGACFICCGIGCLFCGPDW